MKITKDESGSSWVMAESDEEISLSRPLPDGYVPCDDSLILIVDDEYLVRDVHQRIIEHHIPGYQIIKARDGVEGVEMFEANHPRLIVMDLKMPRLDGEGAFFQIRDMCHKEKYEMPCVVFCTAYDTPAGIRGIVSDDPRHCIVRKPPPTEIFMKALQSRLRPLPEAAGQAEDQASEGSEA